MSSTPRVRCRPPSGGFAQVRLGFGLGVLFAGMGCSDAHRDLAFLPTGVDQVTDPAGPPVPSTGAGSGFQDPPDNTALEPSASPPPSTQEMPASPSAQPDPGVLPPSDLFPTSIAGIDVGAIAQVVNQRPDASASLSGGTSGGGSFEQAAQTGNLVEVSSPAQLLDAVSGDEPRVVLLHPGVYALGVESYLVSSCLVPCPEGSPRLSENRPAGKCTGETGALQMLPSTLRRLQLGSNKTIVGLGAGATLQHVELDLSGSRNIILRNLEITSVNPGLVGFGNAILMWPSEHVWVDHSSFSSSSHTFINIHSDWDDASIAITTPASHITLSYNAFNGWSQDTCNGRQNWGIGTQRNPALSVHHNVMVGSDRGTPYLFGSETWGHVYNNLVEDTVTYGVGVSCGAQGLIEGNVFVQDTFALHVGDEGQPSWPFCAPGLFGRAWFPAGDPADVASNLVDAASGLRVFDQALDGASLQLPQAGITQRTISVPLPGGSESYGYQLDRATPEWAAGLVEQAGVGRLF